jgi:hypothetical protein
MLANHEGLLSLWPNHVKSESTSMSDSRAQAETTCGPQKNIQGVPLVAAAAPSDLLSN